MFPVKRPETVADFYKMGHRPQYPEGTEMVYANFTPRSDRLARVIKESWEEKVVFFGLQAFVKEFLIDIWNHEFFAKPKEEVLARFKRRIDTSLGPNQIGVDHIAALHDLGYLPIQIKALPEGSRVNMKIPVLTIKNTLPEFFWLTNALETVISETLWKPLTSATTANEYRKLLTAFAEKTGTALEFVQWQGHDFSMRGMAGFDDAVLSGAAHLAVGLTGTDTIPAIDFLEDYYNADADKELIGGSVSATEHSVASLNIIDIEEFLKTTGQWNGYTVGELSA